MNKWPPNKRLARSVRRRVIHRLRTALVPLALAVVLLPAGCSWTTWLVVANRTNHPLHLEYTVHPGLFFPRPAAKAVRYMDNDDVPWKPLAPPALIGDSARGYALVVPPDTAVRIYYLPTYTGPDAGYSAFFAGLHLTAETTHGRVTYEGGEVLRAFRKVNRFLWVLELD